MRPFKKAAALLCAAVAVGALSAAAEELRWDFDREKDAEGWIKTNCTGDVDAYGHFNLSAITNGAGNYDPFISHEVDIDAADYPYVVLCMKWENERNTATSCHCYFSTDTAGLSESTRVGNPSADGKTTDGKYLVRVFDMTTNENWKGKVTRIRLDTIDGAGTFSVDYVYLTDTLPDTFDYITTGSAVGGKAAEVKGFTETRTYSDGLFADVPKNEWYHDSIAKAYALGFVNGVGENRYDPDGTMTVAEALTLASRMNSLYNKIDADFTAQDGEEWFAPYVKYAVGNGLCAADAFDDYERPVKRHEMASVFSRVLPEKTYTTRNIVGFVPDVANDAPYYEDVLLLYNAGILLGSDEYGHFNPDSFITRAEVAAIVDRVALPDMRVSGSLRLPDDEKRTLPRVDGEGYYLIDNPSLLYGTGLQDAFRYNVAGAKVTTVTNVLDDVRENADTYISRAINPEIGGVLHLTFSFRFGYDPNGAYFTVTDAEGAKLFGLFTDHGRFMLNSAGKELPLGVRADINVDYTADVLLDLDAKAYTLYLSGVYCGTHAFVENVKNAAAFTYGTSVKGTPMVNLTSLFLTKNYALLDNFSSKSAYGAFAYEAEEGTEYTVNGELTVKAKAHKSFTATASAAKVSGKAVFQTLVYTDTTADGISFTLTGNGETVLSLEMKDGRFVSGGRTFDKTVAADMWNLLRVETDRKTGKAVVKLNGKVLGEAALSGTADGIDGFAFAVKSDKDMTVKLDELYLTEMAEYAEYVPEPKTVTSDYILGINVCSLWREGYHLGWGAISPFEEIEPVLGFYDEGNPEVADWEIKYFAEHGIDYQLLCWYGSGVKGPVKLGRGSASALHDGYFNAKYSDKVKFAIMWENSSNTPTLENFKKYVVPYWVEYYLTDERYMTVKNRPVISVWSVGLLVDKWGLDGAREATAYLRQTCKDLGFDDALLLCADGHSTRAAQFKSLASIGCDATYAYHWNEGGRTAYTHIGRMTNYLTYNDDPSVPSEEKITLIPTVSVGFNSIGWHAKRTGLITDDEYKKAADFVKSDVLPTLKGTPMEDMVIISTWNEYGEGTYMMPSKSLGFKNLDNVRRNFTDAPEAHEDVVPTEEQKARIGRLYPQSQYNLAPLYEADISEYPQTVVYRIKIDEKNKDEYEFYAPGTWEFNKDGNYTTVNESGNPIIFNKQPIDLNIDNCSYIRVTMRGKRDVDLENLTGYFFFATDDYPSVEEPTRTAFTYPNGGEMATYYINMAANSRWHGNLKTLRIDPCGNGEFELDSIEILENDAKIAVRVNGQPLKTYGVPNTDDGHLLIPAVPSYGVFRDIGADYDWDKASGTLTVTGNGHTVVFTVGKDEATVDGKQEKLYTAVTLFDNVPLLPYDFLVQRLGYAYVRTETEITIDTHFGA